jgi:cytochrome c oxidase subunit II
MRLHRTRCYVRRRWWIPTLALLAAVLAGCSTESGPDNHQNSLRPQGRYAKKIDHLFTPVFWVAVVVGILVIGGVIYIAVRFRVRKGEDVRPKQTHGNTRLEIGWTIVPAVILLIIAVPTVSTIFSLAKEPKDALQVTVIAKQWWWEFEYPKTADGPQVVTADEMHIPTNRDVVVTLKACDESLPGGETLPNGTTTPGCNVIHSFWVPALAGKRDVVPGHDNQLKLRADETGTFLGQCAEYCGLSHANMRFRVIAQSPDDYDAWLAGQREGPAAKLSGEAKQLFGITFACGGCHTTAESGTSTYGPNLTHLRSRTTFASGNYELTRENLIKWLLDAPSLIPMQSEDCRIGPPGTPGVTCVGMPSFTKNTPKGQKAMTRQQAEVLADYLLSLK